MSLLPWSRANTLLLRKPSAYCRRIPRVHVRNQATTTSSIDPDEISHFNRLASTWWDPYGPSRPLHQMNPLRHDFIHSCLSASPNMSERRSYLDIGCGGGIFAESAARLQATKKVCALDPSEEVIAVARRHAWNDPLFAEPGRLVYFNKTIEQMSVPESQCDLFDVVTLFEVLEHVTYPSAFLHSCLRFVKPGGWLIMSTIARTWTSWFTTKLVAEEVAGLVPRGTHEWAKYINPSELRAWFEEQEGWGNNGGMKVLGVIYAPGLGWRSVPGAENWGNYFLGVRKNL